MRPSNDTDHITAQINWLWRGIVAVGVVAILPLLMAASGVLRVSIVTADKYKITGGEEGVVTTETQNRDGVMSTHLTGFTHQRIQLPGGGSGYRILNKNAKYDAPADQWNIGDRLTFKHLGPGRFLLTVDRSTGVSDTPPCQISVQPIDSRREFIAFVLPQDPSYRDNGNASSFLIKTIRLQISNSNGEFSEEDCGIAVTVSIASK